MGNILSFLADKPEDVTVFFDFINAAYGVQVSFKSSPVSNNYYKAVISDSSNYSFIVDMYNGSTIFDLTDPYMFGYMLGWVHSKKPALGQFSNTFQRHTVGRYACIERPH
jgi:hypothetical protein